MKVMSKITNLSPKDVIDRAEAFFNAKYGLNMLESNHTCCAYFQGETGFVAVRVVPSGKHNEAILETREWDYQIQEFLKTL